MMAATMRVYEGQSASVTVKLANPDGTAYNLTTATAVTLSVKDNPDDTADDLTVTGTVTDAAGGAVRFDFAPVTLAPGTYRYWLKVTTATGTTVALSDHLEVRNT